MTDAEKARKMRAMTGLTQRELADFMRVSRGTIARWEGGQSPISAASMHHLALSCSFLSAANSMTAGGGCDTL